MIFIETGFDKNTNDIYALTKAFYPGEEVRITGGQNTDPDMYHTVIKAENCGKVGKLVYKYGEGDIFEVDVPTDDRDELKRIIYRVLSKRTGVELPWGSLTGIRPTKMVRDRLEAGMSDDIINNDMKQCYYISQEKMRLALEIAKREIDLVRPLSPSNHYSLYVNIPFCPTRCLYCSFTSNAVGTNRTKVCEYLETLFREIRETSGILKGRVLDTVYIGGGTPTALLPEEMDNLLSVLEDSFDMGSIHELTVEAGRPDSFSVGKLRVLKRHNVTRISVNPQSMNQKTLNIIGRKHTVEQTKDAFHMARDEGFENINMDMIIGLPGERSEDVRNTVDTLCQLNPDSLTVHSLALKRASVMNVMLNSPYSIDNKTKETLQENIRRESNNKELNDIAAVSPKEAELMMKIASDGAKSLGMHPYYLYRQKNMAGNLENTGYAKEGKYGLYNILINEEIQDILALGAGAISKCIDEKGNTKRSANYKAVHDYISGIDEMIDRKRRLFNK
ncbi:MAG: coproporphyrinogen dehydrogenase HemZ [Lachnospiraceae bacterium]|nr:coproporphyrinogen dehydrogenase HemZ [Lachnospiraceae bacterium]